MPATADWYFAKDGHSIGPFPFSRLAGRIIAAAVRQTGHANQDEGAVLGGFG